MSTPTKRRNIDEILNRPRMQNALSEQARVLAGEIKIHQGDITDVDKKIYDQEGFNYEESLQKESEVERLKQRLYILRSISQIFEFNATKTIQKTQEQINSLQSC